MNKVAEGKGNFASMRRLSLRDLVEMGVVDPTKVARTALQNAASVAGLLLTPTLRCRAGGRERGCQPAGRAWRHGGMRGWICKSGPDSGASLNTCQWTIGRDRGLHRRPFFSAGEFAVSWRSQHPMGVGFFPDFKDDRDSDLNLGMVNR